MPTATGKAWYLLRKTASKLARMEHHYTFLKACCEENLIPHGLSFKTDVGLRLYPWMLEKYSVEKHAFISHRIQDLASDAYIIMTDLHAEYFLLNPTSKDAFVHRFVTNYLNVHMHF